MLKPIADKCDLTKINKKIIFVIFKINQYKKINYTDTILVHHTGVYNIIIETNLWIGQNLRGQKEISQNQ